MTKKIEIRNLKNISRLRFAIPDPGVYLLTGNNGSGKTSLLTCLHRIGMSNAFQVNFRTSSHSTLDSFLDAEIEYENTGKSVVYKYSGERWAPTPKSHSDLLRSYNFPAVLYIAADGTRIDPRKEEFEPRRVRLSSQPVRDALRDIFKTRKFDELCYINIQRGVGHKAYLIRHRNSQGNPQYFSEKNFSLGELCVLRLVLSLTDCKPKSLILIDELELALHPKAQVSLFRYIERIAKEKELTVLFSTHSVSLVKTAERKQILFLDDSSGNVECISGCYPAQVLGHLAFGEEAAPDIVILVEDNHAKYCLNALLRLYEEVSLAGRPKPTIAVAPLGGFIQILHFLDSAPTLLPIKTKVLGFLDQDVKQESLVAYQAQANHTVLAMFDRLATKISYLPWTPELGICDLFTSDLTQMEAKLKAFFGDQRIQLSAFDWQGLGALEGSAKRKRAKKIFGEMSTEIAALKGEELETIKKGLFLFHAETTYRNNHGPLQQLLGPAIS